MAKKKKTPVKVEKTGPTKREKLDARKKMVYAVIVALLSVGLLGSSVAGYAYLFN